MTLAQAVLILIVVPIGAYLLVRFGSVAYFKSKSEFDNKKE